MKILSLFTSSKKLEFRASVLLSKPISLSALFLLMNHAQLFGQLDHYISPVTIAGHDIAEINISSELSGFPNAKYPYARNSNGCGPYDDWKWILVPGGFFGLADFTSACNFHDKCYLTSDNRDLCDTKFYNALVDVCNTSEHVNKQNCIRVAELFRDAVRDGGSVPHQKARILQRNYENWLLNVVTIVGKYKFTGTNSNGTEYGEGICEVTIKDGYLKFSWQLGHDYWVGNGIMDYQGKTLITFNGKFSGYGTYIFNKNNKTIQGTWGAVGYTDTGIELLLPIE